MAPFQSSDSRLWRKIVEASHDAVVVVDRTGAVEYANESATELFGYASGALEGRAVEELIPHRFRADHEGHVRDFIERPTSRPMGSEMELFGRRSDGTEFPVDVSLTPLRIQGTLHVVAAVRDATERRRYQRKLLQADKLESISRLAGGLAHELNNLLTTIRGSADLALTELPDTHRAADDVERIQGSIDACRSLVNQLLRFARTGDDEEERVVDLAALLVDLEPTLEALLADDITLAIRVPEEGVAVRASPALLRQVVVDLTLNARDAMPEGGRLELVLRRSRGSGQEAGDDSDPAAGCGAVLSVRDTGHGIAPEHRDRIFDPFFSTRRDEGGTGLGLSTVFGIVREAGGSLEVESELGRGTTFTVELPIVRAGGETPESDGRPGP